MTLCEWLDNHLDKPARVNNTGQDSRLITIFDSLAYRVDYKNRRIVSGTQINGHFKPDNAIFEVGRPLASPFWLLPILKNLSLACAEQGDLFFEMSLMDDLAHWLSSTAYRLLLRNPVFQNFRQNSLPRMLNISKDIYGIALAARPRPVGPMIDSRTLNDVWHNEKTFRQVARENPQLLPLMSAFVEQIQPGEKIYSRDPVLTLKTRLRDSGLSDAGWRYLVRHGSRLFRIPWEITAGQAPFEVAIRYLEGLESAGLPPPPPPSVVKALLHCYSQHHLIDAHLDEGFQETIDPVVLRAGLLEADRHRLAGTLEGFAEEFLGVCWWSEALPDGLDDNQSKAGWKWFVRQWLEEEEANVLLENTEPQQWVTRLDEFRMGRMSVLPLSSSESLIRESLAMRNCLQTYIEECANGRFEVYSVRETKTGKRKGCVGLRLDNIDCWTIADVKGFANSPPIGEVEKVAHELFKRMQEIDD